MIINPVYDFYSQAAPQSFRDGIQTAINILDSNIGIGYNITVNITIGYGEINSGQALPNQNTSEGNWQNVMYLNYSQLRADLINTSSTDPSSASLPNALSVNGQSYFAISSAQQKLFGLRSPSAGTIDGEIGMGTGFTGNVLVAGALHELTHALGRTAGSSLDLFRFTSPGNRLFGSNVPANPSYLSFDNGATRAADFGQSSDPGDFLLFGGNLTPNDPFNEYFGNLPNLTSLDIKLMDALGFRSTPPGNPPPSGTTADMVLRRSDGMYEIYDIGNNSVLAGYQLGQVGADYQFVSLGAFYGTDTSDMLLRSNTTGSFEIYNISNNKITGAASLGAVGLDWQVMGFGNFSSRGENDMIARNSSSGGVEVYDINNNQLTGAAYLGAVGLDWQVAGFGNFSSRGTSDMILRNVNTGGLEVYNINSNAITGAAYIGAVGTDWNVVGVGNFSGVSGKSDFMMRNVNTGGFEIYDIRSNQVTSAYYIGAVGLDWEVAGFGPFSGAGTSDMVLRNKTTGAFEVYDIANNHLTTAANLGQVGLDWELGGFAPYAATGSTGSPAGFVASSSLSASANQQTFQLVQAMAGFSPAAAADTSSIGLAPPDVAGGGQLGSLAASHLV